MKTIITKLMVVIISGAFGAVAHGQMAVKDRDLVKLEKTRSGLFIIRENKIYEVLELPTENASFQDSYRNESRKGG